MPIAVYKAFRVLFELLEDRSLSEWHRKGILRLMKTIATRFANDAEFRATANVIFNSPRSEGRECVEKRLI